MLSIENVIKKKLLVSKKTIRDTKKTLSKMKNSISQQIYAGYEKNLKKQNCSLEKYLRICYLLFFIRVVYFLLLIKNVFLKIKNLTFPPKYTGYEKNVKKQNCLFQRDLQIFW